jgi:hypothetical protein
VNARGGVWLASLCAGRTTQRPRRAPASGARFSTPGRLLTGRRPPSKDHGVVGRCIRSGRGTGLWGCMRISLRRLQVWHQQSVYPCIKGHEGEGYLSVAERRRAWNQ